MADETNNLSNLPYHNAETEKIAEERAAELESEQTRALPEIEVEPAE